MAKRDPHGVLGVEAGASATQIKAAWRRLARTNHPDLTGDDPAASRLATRRMAEIKRCLRGADSRWRRFAQRPGSAARRHPVRTRRRPAPRWAPATQAHAPRDGSCRHERRLPATEPGDRQHGGPDAPARTATEADRHRRPRAPARVDTDRPPRPRSSPQLPAPARALARGGRGHGHPVRQVPRPHARPDRGLRTVVHRLGRGHRQPRSGSRQRGTGHPGRSRPSRGRASHPSDHRAPRDHSAQRLIRPDQPGTARSPSDTGGRPWRG
ncbi:MAG TPA: DnaJ domain-containing protein [Candidatus Limnocylindrales bacterium]